jgi:cellulose synthase/poly-beta-1,6-N-acetylglucosamine synthase-like glycosyltransferase
MLQASVIIACYNEERDIPRCLTDLLSQDYENLEIIVVDDGSTDRTVQLVKTFEEKSPKVKLFLLGERRGPGNARNTGAKASSGEVLIFRDADSKAPDTHFIRNLVEPFEDFGVQAVLASSYALIPTPSFLERTLILSHYGHRLRRRGSLPEAYRKALFLEVGGFNSNLGFGEDVDLATRVLARPIKLAYTKGPVQVGAEVRSLRELVRRELWYGSTILGYLQRRPSALVRVMYAILHPAVLFGVVLSLLWRPLLPVSLLGLLLLLVYPFWKVVLSIRNTSRFVESLFIPVLQLFQGLVLSVGLVSRLVRAALRR